MAIQKHKKARCVVHTYNSRTQEAEARRPRIPGQPWLNNEILSLENKEEKNQSTEQRKYIKPHH
jgi:hypothetical protein